MSTERYVIACDRQLEVLRQLPSTEDEQEAGAELVRLLDASEQRIATLEQDNNNAEAALQAAGHYSAALADTVKVLEQDNAGLRAIAERWIALVGDVSDGRLWPITGGLVNATRAALAQGRGKP